MGHLNTASVSKWFNPAGVDNLLVRLAKEHTIFPRFRAEADNKYKKDDPMINYLFGYYGFQEVLNEDLTWCLNEIVDTWDATNTKGKLSYRRKVEVALRLVEEIIEFERLNNISFFNADRQALIAAVNQGQRRVVVAQPVRIKA